MLSSTLGWIFGKGIKNLAENILTILRFMDRKFSKRKKFRSRNLYCDKIKNTGFIRCIAVLGLDCCLGLPHDYLRPWY